MQHLKVHVFEIDILAQMLEQSRIEQDLEFFGGRSTAILVSLLVSPKSDVSGNVPRTDLQRLSMFRNVQSGQDFRDQAARFLNVLAILETFTLEKLADTTR